MENEIQELPQGTAASSQPVETKVDNGTETKNGDQNRSQALKAARDQLLGKPKVEVQEPKVEKEVDEGKGEGSGAEGSSKPAEEKNTQLPEDVQKLRSHDKKQISKLVAQKHALKEENARLQDTLKKLQEKYSKEPQPEDFGEDVNAYNRAKIKYDFEMEQGVDSFKAAKQQFEEKKNSEWTERCQTTVKDFKKFATNYQKYHGWLSENEPEIMGFASQSVVGPRIVEEAFDDLFVRKESYDMWRGLSKQGKIQLLTKMEAQMMSQLNNGNAQPRQAAQPQKSNAPTPIAPEKVSEKLAGKSSNRAEMLARERQRLLSR